MDIIEIIIAGLIAITSPPPVATHVEVDFATEFATVKNGERDKLAGGPSPCIKRLVRPTDNLIAHRYLPCGTKVRLTNLRNEKTTISWVGERGPYGACTKKGWSKFHPEDPSKPNTCPRKPRNYWKLKRCTKKPNGKWFPKKCKEPKYRKKMGAKGVHRGGFDLTTKVARRLGHNGFELIKLEVIK